MPIYEYQCTECEHRLEALQKISAEPLIECPECGKPALKKLVSAASFRLKGGGWYETDFKKDKRKQLAESDSAKSGSGEDKKSDTGGTDKSGKSENSGKSDNSESAEKSSKKDADSSGAARTAETKPVSKPKSE